MALSTSLRGRLVAGRYLAGPLLASGGMGHVYAATHSATGRAVALKLLRREYASHPEVVRRVASEARLAVEASHPNVVDVLDAGVDEAVGPYVVLERLYGMALDGLLAQPLSTLATAQALIPVMNALAALHRAGIVHRDLKPSNIFLHWTENGSITPKLLDFGIAKALRSHTATLTGLALGTPAYMSPEQALGCPEVGPPTDIWSITLVWVRCLSGRLPFEGAAGAPRRPLSSGLRLDDLRGVPNAAAERLIAGLSFEPLERPSSMETLRDELLRALRNDQPALDWPTQLSVSFPGESELAQVLRRGRPAHDSTPTFGRAHGVVTRSVPARASSASTWRLPLALGLTVGVGVATLVGTSASTHSVRPADVPLRSIEERESASREALGRPAPEPLGRPAPEPLGRPATVVASDEAPVPPSPSPLVRAPRVEQAPSRAASRPPSTGVRRPGGSRGGTREPALLARRGSEDPTRTPVSETSTDTAVQRGANRSPIIE